MIRKVGIVMVMGAMLTAMPLSPPAEASGGVGGFLVGCCFGVRTAGAYNEGKQLHFRDWGRIIPYVGAVFAIWDGIEGAQGKTASQLRETYGATYF